MLLGRAVLPTPGSCLAGLAGLLTVGGAFLDANFSFLAFCVQSGQVTSLAFAD
jgi:hypothetical protein